MSDINNFYQLIKNRNIVVPIIQRDYAQGRNKDNISSNRNNFVENILNALVSSEPLNTLFIYGTDINGNDFLPIDGQQRLTSFYLVCWFCAVREIGNDERKRGAFNSVEKFCQETKSFTYQLRTTSEDFFAVLGARTDNNLVHYKDFKEYAKNPNIKLSDFPWFRMTWINDPTVIGALTFLDEVKQQYNKRAKSEKKEDLGLLEKLLSDECPLMFEFVSQNSGHTSDSPKALSAFEEEHRAAVTYTNMNARGKQLNDFENFKVLLSGCADAADFVNKYDRSYINIFFEMANAKGPKDPLARRVERMDRLTLGLLLNLYNDLWLFETPDFEVKTHDELMNIIRHDTDKKKGGIFPKYHFDFIKFIMKEYGGGGLSKEEKQILYDYCDRREGKKAHAATCRFFYSIWSRYRLTSANVSYDKAGWDRLCAHLHLVPPGSKDKDKRDYNYEDCAPIIYALIDHIASNIKTNITELVSDINPRKLYNKVFKRENKKDIVTVAALNEEKIKAQIHLFCTADEQAFFEEISKRHDHAIRYLLYISDYWDNGKVSKKDDRWDRFVKYAGIDEFCNPYDPNNIAWLKAFCVISLPKSDGTVLPADGKLAYWNTECLKWEHDVKQKTQLNKVRELYDLLAQKNYTSLDEYITAVCAPLNPKNWLYHILNPNRTSLEHLDKLLRGTFSGDDSTGYSITFEDSEPGNFFEYVMGLDLEAQKYEIRPELFGEITAFTKPIKGKDNKNKTNLTIVVKYDPRYVINSDGTWTVFRKEDGKVFHRYKYDGKQFLWEYDTKPFDLAPVMNKLKDDINALFENELLGKDKKWTDEQFLELMRNLDSTAIPNALGPEIEKYLNGKQIQLSAIEKRQNTITISLKRTSDTAFTNARAGCPPLAYSDMLEEFAKLK